MKNEAMEQTPDASGHHLDDLSQVGKDFINAAAGKGEGAFRDPGLLVTNEDVRAIRRYVNTGLALPTDLQQIRQLLGNYESTVAGLSPEDIQRLYGDIREHAASWSGLEDDMRAVGSDLHVFAGNLVSTTQDTIEFIQHLDSWRTLGLEDLTPEQLEQMPPTELVEGDRKKLPGLLALVGELKRHIQVHSASTLRVRDGAAQFKGRLREEIAPGVALKIQLANSVEAGNEVTELREELRRLNERIDQKTKEYEEYCKYRWVGFVWGVIGGAISLSIYGPKASAVLKEKDQLVKERNSLETKLRRLDKFLADLHEFETHLQDLKIRIDGAISGVSNVESLWVLLKDLVDSSYRQLESMDDVKLLVIFVSRFRTMIANWQEIQKQALDLLTAFNKAVEDSRR
ncbi:alpha-xenorhabdolysin family binary toxin subunit A [uncultured Pseudomonas sp.]|uniref:alpha-xenorhabdolysin family binary toxin subunit A n=1 Tax=uncultured Pseudomonas sp. TaxID=114707 RepID=UPI0025F83D6B|nr:alpha-xenorhabdolysin family binary toxin subunit A [uncultured Pseudomonas sp.]